MEKGSTSARTQIQKATTNGRHVWVRWGDYHESRFHPIWLRDNCSCDACGNTASAIRRVRLTDIPFDITVTSVAVQGNGRLQIVWDDGHKTVYDPVWLRNHCYSARERERRRFKPVLWGPELAGQCVPMRRSDSSCLRSCVIMVLSCCMTCLPSPRKPRRWHRWSVSCESTRGSD